MARVVVADAATGSAPANPDAELVQLCAELDAMELRIGALFDFEPSGLTDPRFEAADLAAHLIEAEQRRVLDRVCALAPSTLAGWQALARSLALLCPDLAHAPGEADIEARLTSTLLRGLRGSA